MKWRMKRSFTCTVSRSQGSSAAYSARGLSARIWSNALKFTRSRDRALIHVGHELQGGQSVYFVRDNGSGFDMRHADKLFCARHGGRVWAQAAKNEGTTFYFTLDDASGRSRPH